ncbi:MAG: bifunctional glutamate N-acetyltransferase/amino-acid acetyltransferase ArgJ [Microbacteriaceae bacterium]|nr:bifunctional glutamate N-acetyltransferase/amino-acid acetyltransferase ArgJ [Microbacteriaceae bacterium]
MSVTAARGFEAAGVAAGLRSTGAPDVALVVNRGPRYAVAAVFTSNRSKANPILWSEQAIADGVASAIVLNAGGANCFTGDEGFQTARASAQAVGAALGVPAEHVQVCSTGLIGDVLDRKKVLAGVAGALATLDTGGGTSAARAILTTDTVEKLAVHEGGGWVIGGMAKGAGMLAPALATMLVVITTDVELDSNELDSSLREAMRTTFNRLDSDGCVSTNDQVTLMASGASGVRPALTEFTEALTEVCADLARQLMADAEGANHEITITVRGAASETDAEEVGRSIARSNLFKAAVFGNDPNWGRVLAAIGTTNARFDPYRVDVSMNGVRVCHQGRPDTPRDQVDLSDRAVLVELDLAVGSASATILTNDLTHAYVHENSAYSS